ncbi:MAG TPA: ABC transporter substrate-binding protein, partial [Microthrixaceae bacterium]|nr:ABC transporter substrate-binding protein [Microthrixaceae bacterium]
AEHIEHHNSISHHPAGLCPSCSVSDSKSKAADSDKGTPTTASGIDYAAKFKDNPVQGITETSIKLGIADLDFGKIKEQFGVDTSGGGNAMPDEVMPALVKALNDSGGINGRKVEIVTSKFVPVGTETSEATCRKLIEDEKVFAVIGTFLGDNGLCVTETHKTPYFSGWGLNAERQARSNAPFITVQASEEDLAAEQMKTAIKAGVFKDKKVAVYWDAETNDALINDVLIPTLEKGGVTVVGSAKLPESGGDQVKSGQDIDTIFERFKADGADAVVINSGLGVPIPAIERSTWSPRWVFTNAQSSSSLTGFGLKTPARLTDAAAVTVAIPQEVMEKSPGYLDCLKRINANSDLNLKPTDDRRAKDFEGSAGAVNVPVACQSWDLTVKVLEAAGKNPTSSSIIAGLSKLKSFSLPGLENASLSPTRWGAGAEPLTWHFDVAKGAFVRDDLAGAGN